MPQAPAVTLFVDPLMVQLEQDHLFDARYSPNSGERILEPYVLLRSRLAARGVATHTADLLGSVPTSPVNLYATVGGERWLSLRTRPELTLSAHFVNECPVAEPRVFKQLPAAGRVFRRLYSFAGDDAMAEFTSERLSYLPFRYPYPFDEVEPEAWARADRSFLSMINGNKVPRLKTRELYTKRLEALSFFEARGEIDLYGVGWDGPPYRIGQTRVPRAVRRELYRAESIWHRLRPEQYPPLAAARRAWRGSVVSKSSVLSGYTFSICFENMILEGWVTEKPFDCLRAGTIPVYLGPPDVERWLDPESFVDMRKFADFAELRDFLLSLGPAEIAAYREAGREYFRSDRFKPFTKETFVEIFERILVEDAGPAL